MAQPSVQKDEAAVTKGVLVGFEISKEIDYEMAASEDRRPMIRRPRRAFKSKRAQGVMPGLAVAGAALKAPHRLFNRASSVHSEPVIVIPDHPKKPASLAERVTQAMQAANNKVRLFSDE